MRFSYIDGRGREIRLESLEALESRIRLGAITDQTPLYDASANRWGPAETHEVFRALSRGDRAGAESALGDAPEAGQPESADEAPPETPEAVPPEATSEGVHRDPPEDGERDEERGDRPTEEVTEESGRSLGTLYPEVAGSDLDAVVGGLTLSPEEEKPTEPDETTSDRLEPEGDKGPEEVEETKAREEAEELSAREAREAEWRSELVPYGATPGRTSASEAGLEPDEEEEEDEADPFGPEFWAEGSEQEGAAGSALAGGARPTERGEEFELAASVPAPPPLDEESEELDLPVAVADDADRGGSWRRFLSLPYLLVLLSFGIFAIIVARASEDPAAPAASRSIAEIRRSLVGFVTGGGGFDREFVPVPIPEGARPVIEGAIAEMLADLDSIQRAHRLQEAPSSVWLQGIYLANASRYPEVEQYWRRYADYIEVARENDDRLFEEALVQEIERGGFAGPTADSLRIEGLRWFNDTRSRRAVTYLQMEVLAEASLDLHEFLLDHEDEIEHAPQRAGTVSPEPILEAVADREKTQERMWAILDRITQALESIQGLGTLSTGRLLGALFDSLGTPVQDDSIGASSSPADTLTGPPPDSGTAAPGIPPDSGGVR